MGFVMPPEPGAIQDRTPAVVELRMYPFVPGDANALNTPEELVCTTPAVVKPDTVIAGVVTVPVNVGEAIVAYKACAVVDPSAFRKLVASPALDETTPDEEFRRTPAVVSEENVGTDKNVWVPVNV
jgi:hypothetical protein